MITTATVNAVCAVTRTKWSEAYCASAVETFYTTGPYRSALPAGTSANTSPSAML